MCPPRRRSDPCRARGPGATSGRPASRDPSGSDANRRRPDDCATADDDARADATSRSSRLSCGIVEGSWAMPRHRSDCSGPTGRQARAKNAARPSPATGEDRDADASTDRWRPRLPPPRLLPPLPAVSRPVQRSLGADDGEDDDWHGASSSRWPSGRYSAARSATDSPTRGSPLDGTIHSATATRTPGDGDDGGDDAAAPACTSSRQHQRRCEVSPRDSHPRRCSSRSRYPNHPARTTLRY